MTQQTVSKMERVQTAVEWLVEKLRMVDKNAYAEIYDEIEQAKQIEKEQIEMAFAKSYLIGLAEVNYDDVNRQAEQYYNENYGGQGSPDTTTSPNTQKT